MNERIISKICKNPIDSTEFLSAPVDSICGAQVVFTGIVRNINRGKKVIQVSYDSFEPLAEKTFREIAKEALAKWGPDLFISIAHRVGDLRVGEMSVLIVVNSKHRDEAYLASRYILEEIKTRAPIWKKEVYETGETEWLRGHSLCGHASREVEHSH